MPWGALPIRTAPLAVVRMLWHTAVRGLAVVPAGTLITVLPT